MSEYTSHDVTSRLIAAGFAEPPDTRWVDADVLPWRSDTLLTWLLKKDAVKVAEAMGVRTLCENGRYGYVQIDVLDNGDWNVSLFRPLEVRVTASTLPDALAEVVLKVLEVSHV